MLSKTDTDNTRTVALYARVSTLEQAEEGFSIDAQIDTLKSFCNNKGYDIHKIYIDRGISGKSIEGREELQKLLEDAEEGLFDELLVWKINRLSRKQLELLKIVDKLTENGIMFRSYSENFETETPMGRFSLQMMGAVAKLERNTIVDNVKLGMKQRARQGKWNGGVVLGYDSVKIPADNKEGYETELQIVPDEALIIKKIFNLYSQGYGFKSIANKLNNGGYKTKHGNLFSISAVRKIIKNPIYIGKIRFNKQKNWNKKRRAGTNPDPIISEGEHEAIISKDLWDKVHTLYDKKSKKPKKKHNYTFLLSGLLKCPECGSSMVMNRTRYTLKDGTVKHQNYYVCGQHRSKGASACHANGIRKEDAEEYVLNRFGELISNQEIIHDLVDKINDKRKNKINPLQDELTQIEQNIKQSREKKEKYFDLFEKGEIDSNMITEKINKISEELKKLKSKRKTIESELEEDSTKPVTFELVENVLENFNILIKKASGEKLKNLLRLAIKEITINEEKKIDSIKLAFDEDVQNHFLNDKNINNNANEGSSNNEDPSSNSNFYASDVIRFPFHNFECSINLF